MSVTTDTIHSMSKKTDAKNIPSDPTLTLRAARALFAMAGRLEARGVKDARDLGWSWGQIGEALGITRQSAHVKYGLRKKQDDVDVDTNYHPWATYIAACKEARRAGEGLVGTDLLLLGLLTRDDIAKLVGHTYTQARDALHELYQGALRSVGIEADVTYNDDIPPAPTGHRLRDVWSYRVHLTPAAKRVLEEAGKPIKRGKDIDPKEVLSKLLDNAPNDPAVSLLSFLGVDVKALKEKLTNSLPKS
jgi:hypothetical protein